MKDHINLGEIKKVGKGTNNQFIMLEKTDNVSGYGLGGRSIWNVFC